LADKSDSLEQLRKNLTAEQLDFLAELSRRPGAGVKLLKNKKLIQTLL
jgi:hypothetical protein